MKRIICIIAITLLACSILCSCGKDDAEDTNTAAKENITEDMSDKAKTAENPTQETTPELKIEDLVGEQFTFNGERGSEEIGYRTSVSYSVPEILSDKKNAKAINDDIRTFCLDVIEPTQDELDFPTWYNIDYESYLNGDILSIIITKDCTMDDAVSRATFNYNIKDDSVTDNLTLIKSCGYTEDAFLDGMRKAVAYESDETMQLMCDSYYYSEGETDYTEKLLMYADNMRYRQNSISTYRINMQMPMYLDDKGELKVIVEIDTMAGSGFYNCILTPKTESHAKDFDLSFEDSLFITYKNGIMKIRIEEGDWAANTFGGAGSNLEFGKEYTVEGIYKDYIDGQMQFLYDVEYAVPVFVSDDGMVSALNIYYCAPAGYFCMTEPIMGIKGIEAITEENDSGIEDNVSDMLIGQCPGFSKRALSMYGQEGFSKIYDTGLKDQSEAYGYYIGFDDEDRFLYQIDLFGNGDSMCYSGECVMTGMNEDGLIFVACVYADYSNDITPHYGAFSLIKHTEWDEISEDLIEWADFRGLNEGFISFDSSDELITLDVSFG